MKSEPTPRIVSAERLKGDLFITFNDGKSALYPAKFLYDSPLCQECPRCGRRNIWRWSLQIP